MLEGGYIPVLKGRDELLLECVDTLLYVVDLPSLLLEFLVVLPVLLLLLLHSL